MDLKNLEKQIKKCKKCRLCEMRTNAVFGSGNLKSKIVFIGEAPGKKEDLEGVPFIGPSGKFLDKMLNSIKMKREDVFITNIVKCRPPNNRDPKPDEIKVCSALYLWKQIEGINPYLIVTLGRYSMYYFLSKNVSISEAHGKFVKIKNKETNKIFNLLPLYHPAVALYNGNFKKILEEDFKKIPKILKNRGKIL